MNKNELVSAVAKQAELSKKDAGLAVEAVLTPLQRLWRREIRFSLSDSEHLMYLREQQEKDTIREPAKQ